MRTEEIACEDCGTVTAETVLVVINVDRWPLELCPGCAERHAPTSAVEVAA